MASQKSLSAEGWGAWTQDAIVGPWGIAPNRVMGPRTLTTELGPHQNKQGLTTVGSAPVERSLPELGSCRLPHNVLLMPRKEPEGGPVELGEAADCITDHVATWISSQQLRLKMAKRSPFFLSPKPRASKLSHLAKQ